MEKIDWLKKQSPHYAFHFLVNSLAQKDINSVILKQEKWYKKIIRTLNVENKRKISYYLYPSRALKKQETQDGGNAHTVWKNFEIHTIYNQKLKILGPHEDTHLLTLDWGISIGLFREGLAEYLHSNWHGKPHNFWAKKFFKRGSVSLTELINNNFFYALDPNLAYPVAGSLAKFLIKQYGLAKFKKAYGSLDKNNSDQKNIKIIEKIYQRSLKDLETSWHSKI